MKSVLLAALFAITGGVALVTALPAEEKTPVIRIQLPKSFPDYGEPVVPQIEQMPPQEEVLPEPLDRYLVAQAKLEKPAPQHPKRLAHRQPNFFQKLLAGFIKLQKPQAAD